MDIEQHKNVAKYTGAHRSNITSISLTPDGTRMYSSGWNGELCFYQVPIIKKGDSVKNISHYGKLPDIR